MFCIVTGDCKKRDWEVTIFPGSLYAIPETQD